MDLNDDEMQQRAEADRREVLMLTNQSWRDLRRTPERVCDLLDAAERGGHPAAVQLLDAWGLEWLQVKGAVPYPPPPPGARMVDVQRAADIAALSQRLIGTHDFYTNN
jgi:hypothetical protein